jgi:hypothetical protein
MANEGDGLEDSGDFAHDCLSNQKPRILVSSIKTRAQSLGIKLRRTLLPDFLLLTNLLVVYAFLSAKGSLVRETRKLKKQNQIDARRVTDTAVKSEFL